MKRSSELTKVRQFENSLRIKRIISKCDLYVPNVKEVSLLTSTVFLTVHNIISILNTSVSRNLNNSFARIPPRLLSLNVCSMAFFFLSFSPNNFQKSHY